jgi:hypothetical protein
VNTAGGLDCANRRILKLFGSFTILTESSMTWVDLKGRSKTHMSGEGLTRVHIMLK